MPPPAINPAKLQAKDLVAILAKSGAKGAKLAWIEKDIAAGCPRNKDGTLHLVHYTAWLATQVK